MLDCYEARLRADIAKRLGYHPPYTSGQKRRITCRFKTVLRVELVRRYRSGSMVLPDRLMHVVEQIERKEAKAITLAEREMGKWKLSGWVVRLGSDPGYAGSCNYATNTITLSSKHVGESTMAEALETIRHEVSHALVGPGHGHGKVWKEKCREVGCRPEK